MPDFINYHYIFLPEITTKIISFLDFNFSSDFDKNFRSVINFFKSTKYGIKYLEIPNEYFKTNFQYYKCVMYLLCKNEKKESIEEFKNIFDLLRNEKKYFVHVFNELVKKKMNDHLFFMIEQTSEYNHKKKNNFIQKIVAILLSITHPKLEIHKIFKYAIPIKNYFLVDIISEDFNKFPSIYLCIKHNDLRTIQKMNEKITRNRIDTFSYDFDDICTMIDNKYYELLEFVVFNLPYRGLQKYAIEYATLVKDEIVLKIFNRKYY